MRARRNQRLWALCGGIGDLFRIEASSMAMTACARYEARRKKAAGEVTIILLRRE